MKFGMKKAEIRWYVECQGSKESRVQLVGPNSVPFGSNNANKIQFWPGEQQNRKTHTLVIYWIESHLYGFVVDKLKKAITKHNSKNNNNDIKNNMCKKQSSSIQMNFAINIIFCVLLCSSSACLRIMS